MKVHIKTRLNPQTGQRQAVGLKILNLPESGTQKVLKTWLDKWKQFISVTDNQVIMHTVDGDVFFDIQYPPGRHCLTCGEQLPTPMEDPYAEKCRAHVKTHGKDAVVSNRWPHGYIALASSYQLQLVTETVKEAS